MVYSLLAILAYNILENKILYAYLKYLSSEEKRVSGHRQRKSIILYSRSQFGKLQSIGKSESQPVFV